MSTALPYAPVPVLGADVAFYVVFGAFAAALVVLSVITLRWAFRRDRAGRARWLERQGGQDPTGRDAAGTGDGRAVPPSTNGHGPQRRRARRPGAPG